MEKSKFLFFVAEFKVKYPIAGQKQHRGKFRCIFQNELVKFLKCLEYKSFTVL